MRYIFANTPSVLDTMKSEKILSFMIGGILLCLLDYDIVFLDNIREPD